MQEGHAFEKREGMLEVEEEEEEEERKMWKIEGARRVRWRGGEEVLRPKAALRWCGGDAPHSRIVMTARHSHIFCRHMSNEDQLQRHAVGKEPKKKLKSFFITKNQPLPRTVRNGHWSHSHGV